MRISGDVHTAMFWDAVLGGVGLFSATLLIHFILLFTNPKKLEQYLTLLYPSYFITLVFVLLYSSFASVSDYKYIAHWGWINTRQSGAFPIILTIFLQFHYVLAIGILSVKLYRSKRTSYLFYQLLLLDIGLILVIGEAIFTEAVLPFNFKMDPLPLTPTVMLIFTFTSFIAVRKFNLFNGIEAISKKALLDTISDIVIVIGREVGIEFINEPGKRYIGIGTKKVKGKSLSAIMKVNDAEAYEDTDKMVEAVFAGKTVRNVRCLMMEENGARIPVLVSSDPIFNRGRINNALLMCRYIGDVEKAEDELRKGERRFKAIIEKAKDAMMLIAADGKIGYVTPSVMNVMGYTPEEMEGTSFADYIHPDFAEKAQEKFEQNNYDTSSNKESIIKVIRKDGTVIWIESIAINHYNEPDVNALVVIFRDITEKYEIAQEKERSLILFQSLIQNMKDAVMVGTAQHKIFTANKEFCNMFDLGTDPLALNGADCSEVALQAKHLMKEPEAFLPAVIQAVRGGRKVFNEQVDFADGRVYERNYVPIYDAKGNLEAHLWQYVNVTERIYHIQEIHRQSAYLEQLFQAAPIGIAMTDSEGRVVNVNRAFELLFEYNREDIQQADLNTLIVPDGLNELTFVASNTLPAQKGVMSQLKCKKKNGELIDVDAIGYPKVIEEAIWGYYSIYVDISSQKSYENEILEKNTALTKINAELDKFVYSVSHDIRSPLMSILGLVNMAETEIKDPVSLEYFNMVKNNVNRLDTFTMEIIQYSRNARTDIIVDILNLKDFVMEIVGSLRYHEKAFGLSFIVEIKDMELFATDKSRLNGILTNLISNAIKYQKKEGKNGYVKISAQLEGGICTLEIEDNGEGIALEKQHAIFDMFTRYSQNSKGSGLGLYIVKENLAKICGNISVESVPGQGSRFTIVVPEIG